jgi:predicted amidohydrolase
MLKRALKFLGMAVVWTVFAATVLAALGTWGFVWGARKSRGTFRPQHPGRVRVALCQYGSRVGDLKWNFGHALAYAEEAVRHGADVVVLPEYAFATVHDLRRKHAWVNLDEEEWMGGALADFARRHRCYLFANHGKTFGEHRQHHLNETTVFGPDGGTVATYQKRFVALIDQRVNFGPSTNGAAAAELPFAKVGLLICKDTAYPDEYAEDYGDVDLLLMQFGHITHWGDEWVPRGLRDEPPHAVKALPRIAKAWTSRLGKPLLMANKTGVEDTFVYLGGSRVVAADGETVVLAGSDETILYVDFPLKEDGRIDTAGAAVPEAPSDFAEGGHARKFRTAVRRLAAMVPEPGKKPWEELWKK